MKGNLMKHADHAFAGNRTRLALALGASVLATAFMAQAQTVYRIVGPDGKVTFSDKPPIAVGKGSEKVTATDRSGRALDLTGASLPFELRQVATRYPVTLYTSNNCGPCATGRAQLTTRGIPFTERTVNTNEDIEALQRLSGENSLPFLTIGGQKIKGYSDTEWTQFLDAAGYPASSKLPGSYRPVPASPLVAVQKPPPAAPAPAENPQTATASPAEPGAAPPANPAGIRF
jgi:glutaredoxin